MSLSVPSYSKSFRTVIRRLFSQISSQWPNKRAGCCSCRYFLAFCCSSFSIQKVLFSLFLWKNREKFKSPQQQRWDYKTASYPENYCWTQSSSTPPVNGIWEHSLITWGALCNCHFWGGTPGNHTQRYWQLLLVGFLQQSPTLWYWRGWCCPWMVLAYHSQGTT